MLPKPYLLLELKHINFLIINKITIEYILFILPLILMCHFNYFILYYHFNLFI